MKTSQCRCGNRIFFNNIHCLACTSDLGRCDQCKMLSSFSTKENVTCCDSCKSMVHQCQNRERKICNCFVAQNNSLCQWCRTTLLVPDLTVTVNVPRLSALESAKRRLLLELESLGLPPYVRNFSQSHALTFQFLEDTVQPDGTVSKVTTGHKEGVITINLNEADSVQREQLRVQFGEPQRTLIGHMRHEVGHYIDWVLATPFAGAQYIQLFGNPDSVDYNQAMKRYYDAGPPSNWADHHVSRYATMHPWEDFAETVNVYLDIMAIAATANDQDLAKLDLTPAANSAKLVEEVLKLVVAVSEFNADLGLLPLLPEQLPPAVMHKLAYVHQLRTLG